MTDKDFKEAEEKYQKIIRRELPEYKEDNDTGRRTGGDDGNDKSFYSPRRSRDSDI